MKPKQQTQVEWVIDQPLTSAEFQITVLKANVVAAMYKQAKDFHGWMTVQLWKTQKH